MQSSAQDIMIKDRQERRKYERCINDIIYNGNRLSNIAACYCFIIKL